MPTTATQPYAQRRDQEQVHDVEFTSRDLDDRVLAREIGKVRASHDPAAYRFRVKVLNRLHGHFESVSGVELHQMADAEVEAATEADRLMCTAHNSQQWALGQIGDRVRNGEPVRDLLAEVQRKTLEHFSDEVLAQELQRRSGGGDERS